MTKQQKQIIRFIAECAVWIAMIVITAMHSIISGLITVIVAVLIFIAPNLNCGKSKNAKRKEQDLQDMQKDDEYDEWREYEKSKRKLLEKYAKIDCEYNDKKRKRKVKFWAINWLDSHSLDTLYATLFAQYDNF